MLKIRGLVYVNKIIILTNIILIFVQIIAKSWIFVCICLKLDFDFYSELNQNYGKYLTQFSNSLHNNSKFYF